MSREPDLITPPHLAAVLDALRQREPIFHHPGFGTLRADYARMTVDDFREIGASGQRYSRDDWKIVLHQGTVVATGVEWTR